MNESEIRQGQRIAVELFMIIITLAIGFYLGWFLKPMHIHGDFAATEIKILRECFEVGQVRIEGKWYIIPTKQIKPVSEETGTAISW